jgi:hypothetical protein
MRNTYHVYLSNIGHVYTGHSREAADKEFVECTREAKQPYGRASGETVTLMKNGELVREFNPNERRRRRRPATSYTRAFIENEMLSVAPVPYKDVDTFAIKIENRTSDDTRATKWINITGWQMRRIERLLML